MGEKILVTGGTGLIGKAIQKISINYNYEFLFIGSKDCDLTNFDETLEYFNKIKPDYVLHLAACVGGLFKNMNHKVEMYEKNIQINNNVLKSCHLVNVKKVISCLSTFIFHDKKEYANDEAMLHNGPIQYSHDDYPHAKRMI